MTTIGELSKLGLSDQHQKLYLDILHNMHLSVNKRWRKDIGDDLVVSDLFTGETIGAFDDVFPVIMELGWLQPHGARGQHLAYNINFIKTHKYDDMAKALEYVMNVDGRMPVDVAYQMWDNNVPIGVAIKAYRNDIDPALAGSLASA